ncbi:MAG: hypothetical protein E7419_02455 [Ruminococcaceae bacterium]|nr:hypothetical protein [Oscillospiraceae bacterium]
MKKFLSIFLAVIICFSSVSVLAFDADGFPEFMPQVNIGRANWSAETHNGTICYDREGNPLMCFTTQGGFFWVIDLMTGHVRECFNTIGTYIMAHLVSTASDGKVYVHFYPGNVFNVYDPIANTYTVLNDGSGYHSQDGGVITEDDIVYLGEYRDEGARVFEYNIKTNEYKYYPISDVKCTYVKGVTYDDKYIYAGTGTGAENTKMFRIDKETGEQTIFLEDTGGGIIYTAYMINGKIVANTNGRLHIVDPKTLEKEISIPSSHSRQGEIFPSPYDGRVFYHYREGALWCYNTETREHNKVVACPLTETLAWAELSNGDWVLSLRSDAMEKIGYFNPKTNEVTVLNLDRIADAGPNGQGFDISPEGILYRGGYQTSMGAYNINSGEFIFSMPKWHQNEGTGFLNGKVYFGVYVDAVMYRYDPEKPLTEDYLSYNYNNIYQGYDANPSMTFDIEYGQDRPFVVEGYNDKLYIGTMSGYNISGGALVIMEEEDGINPPKAEVYNNIINGQSITGIAVKDNLVYVSSTARNGKGEFEYPDLSPQIIVFDENKKEVVNTVTPDLPVVGTNAKTIGDISFGPDGLLYGAVADRDGLIFAMDPETFEVVRYVSLNTGFEKVPQARQAYLRWGDDGLLYTTCGWDVSVVNPFTMEYKKITPNCSLMTLDHNGNLWYSKGAYVFNRYINQYDRLQGFLNILDTYLNKEDYTANEWAELQKEIEKAKKYTKETDWKDIQDTIRIIKGLRDKKPYVKPTNDIDIIFNGEKLDYDYDTTGTIKLYNGTTYVPYRAYLEMLGYKVTWNVHASKITATKDGSEISMIVHKNDYIFNGEKVESDICPILLSGRQYIPVRLISEKLGYEVKWNEEENKVYVDKK